MKLLLERDVKVDSRDTEYGLMPLLWAALKGHASVVKILLNKDANVNV